MSEYDTTKKVEQTEHGYRLTVESKRGTGTRDQDKVTAELRTEEQPSQGEIGSLTEDVRFAMDRRRQHQPDTEGE